MTGPALERSVTPGVVPLEDELRRLVGQNRNGYISARYFGFDGAGGVSLQKVGDQYGITRERVRQIVSAIAGHLAATRPATPSLDRVISFAQSHAPIRAAECEEKLLVEGLTSTRFCLEGVLQAAELLGKGAPFLLSDQEPKTVLGSLSVSLFRTVIRAAQIEIDSYGMTTVSRVIAKARSNESRHCSTAFVKRALVSRSDFRWLDEAKG